MAKRVTIANRPKDIDLLVKIAYEGEEGDYTPIHGGSYQDFFFDSRVSTFFLTIKKKDDGEIICRRVSLSADKCYVVTGALHVRVADRIKHWKIIGDC